MSWKEGLVGLVILVVLGILMLPMLSRSRSASRRASCQNNLKQLGLVIKMYANENREGELPPLSPVYGNWIMDPSSVYPEYLTDLGVLICPSKSSASPQAFRLRSTHNHPDQGVGDLHPDCVTGRFYTYTSFRLNGDEPALALYTAYHMDPAQVRGASMLELPIPRWENSVWNPRVSGMPIVWDRIPFEESELPHVGRVINVLTMDGAVQSVRYSPLNQSENFPVTELSTWTFSADVPRLDSDCY